MTTNLPKYILTIFCVKSIYNFLNNLKSSCNYFGFLTHSSKTWLQESVILNALPHDLWKNLDIFSNMKIEYKRHINWKCKGCVFVFVTIFVIIIGLILETKSAQGLLFFFFHQKIFCFIIFLEFWSYHCSSRNSNFK